MTSATQDPENYLYSATSVDRFWNVYMKKLFPFTIGLSRRTAYLSGLLPATRRSIIVICATGSKFGNNVLGVLDSNECILGSL
jgi:hypothetical protein